MAGESMKDIKTRIRSVESTMQITKALQLVATSKLRGARERVERAGPFFELLQDTMQQIVKSNREVSSVYTANREKKRTCYLVIAGDRGLAGGYNNNVYKALWETADINDLFLPIGKKALEHLRYHKCELLSEEYDTAAHITVSQCFSVGQLLTDAFAEGQFDQLMIVYTKFFSMLRQEPQTNKLLPFSAQRTQTSVALTIYEPSAEAVFEAIVPQYVGGVLYGALSESIASELAARRIAMESATGNAEELIDDLSLKYNRARQAAITQELSEIMSGAEV